MSNGASPDQPESAHTTRPASNQFPPGSPGSTSQTYSGDTGSPFGTSFSSSKPGSSEGWSEQAANLVVETVDKIRLATTDRIITAAKAVVYGLTIGLVLLLVLPIALILLFRIVDVYLPGNVWGTYLLFGLVSLVTGATLWSKRKPNLATNNY